MIYSTGSFLLSDYAREIADTDVLDPSEISPILQGLYGEVGGIMSTAKKHIREKSAYPGFKRAAEEEFGDTLWYLAALCRRLSIPLDELSRRPRAATLQDDRLLQAIWSKGHSPMSQCRFRLIRSMGRFFRLGRSAAALLETAPDRAKIVEFASDYLDALHAAKLAFAEVARGNLRKARGAFIAPQPRGSGRLR